LVVVITFLVTAFASAGEVQVAEIGQKELFSYGRIEQEFYLESFPESAGIKVKLLPSLSTFIMPEVRRVPLSNLMIDTNAGSINLHDQGQVVTCAVLKKKKASEITKNFKLTGDCKFEQRIVDDKQDDGTPINKMQIYIVY
jgi:hypothetical protein